MNEKAEHYNKHGLRLLLNGQTQEALDFFSKAIEIDPQSSEAYFNRGQLLVEMGHIIEGNADIHKSKDLRSGKIKPQDLRNGKNKNGKRTKLNWQDIESIYDTVFPLDPEEDDNETRQAEDHFEYQFFQGTDTDQKDIREKVIQYAKKSPSYPAILEFLNGNHLEVARLRLFEPTSNDVSIIREDGHVERVVPLKNITCIRHAEPPPVFQKAFNASSQNREEQIETISGCVYNAEVQPGQKNDQVLCCLCRDEENCFSYTFIPRVNIRKRCMVSPLGEILQKKGLISDDTLQSILFEHQQAKTLELGKIIAEKAKVPIAAIEKELEQAKKSEGFKGLKTGEILLASGIAKEEQILVALQYQEYLKKMKIGQYLIDKGILSEQDVFTALAEKFMVPFVDLSKLKVPQNTLSFLPKDLVMENEILPIALENNVLTVATPIPDSAHLRQAIMEACDIGDVHFVLSQPSHLKIVINQLYNQNPAN